MKETQNFIIISLAALGSCLFWGFFLPWGTQPFIIELVIGGGAFIAGTFFLMTCIELLLRVGRYLLNNK